VPNLKELDVKILKIIQEDAAIPTAELASRLGSSKSVCWRRIQRMQEKGIIQKRVTLVDPKKVGLNVTLFAQIKMTAHGRTILPEFIQAIQELSPVIECHTMIGNIDFLLKIIVRDIAEYEEFFLHTLSQINGVQEVNTTIAMTPVKHTTALPIDFRED
jgi:Lrp/AsnC family transcriptional regulator